MGHIKSAAHIARSSLTRLGRYARPFSLRVQDALTERLFPHVVAVLTHPYMITLTMAMLVPLLLLSNVVSVTLAGNTFLNVASASVSMIVLYQSLHHHRETKRLHTEAQDERARIQKAHSDDVAEVRRLVQHLANYTAALREDVGRLEKQLGAQQAARRAPASMPPSVPLAPVEPRSPKKSSRKPKARSQFDPMDPIEED